jgi:hypothetical protein
MPLDRDILARFHHVLVDEVRRTSPEYLTGEFTVAEIYQKLVPYGVHRDRIGVEMNGDYEDALLRLLAGEGDLLLLQSEPAKQRIRRELESSNPNTGIYREFAAVGVRLNPHRIPPEGHGGATFGPAKAGGPLLRIETAPEVSRPHRFELAAPGSGDPGEEGEEEGGESRHREPRTRRTGPPAAAAEPEGEAAQTEGESAHPSACPGCSRDLPSRASLRFCPYCGVNVLERTCGECGEGLDWQWAFCPACGTQVDQD